MGLMMLGAALCLQGKLHVLFNDSPRVRHCRSSLPGGRLKLILVVNRSSVLSCKVELSKTIAAMFFS
jgi:hypothetical protein